jgi:hypothetical protein
VIDNENLEPSCVDIGGQTWVYGRITPQAKMEGAKVGLIVTPEHQTERIRALKREGYRVIKLGGNTHSIPSSIKFVILCHQSCSHHSSDTAFAWVRRSPKTRTLVITNSVTGVRLAAQGYRDGFPMEAPPETAPETAPEPETKPKRAKRKRPADFTSTPRPTPTEEPLMPTPKPTTEPKLVPDSTPPALQDLSARFHRVYAAVADGNHTIDAICAALGYTHSSSASGALSKLRKAGAIHKVHLSQQRYKGPHAYFVTVEQFTGGLDTGPKIRRVIKAAPVRSCTPEPNSMPAPTPKPTPVPEAGGAPIDSVKDELRLILLWMQEWHVRTAVIQLDGTVTLSNTPTKTASIPEISVKIIEGS